MSWPRKTSYHHHAPRFSLNRGIPDLQNDVYGHGKSEQQSDHRAHLFDVQEGHRGAHFLWIPEYTQRRVWILGGR